MDNLWIGARTGSAIVIFWRFPGFYEIVMVAYREACRIFPFAAAKNDTLMATNKIALAKSMIGGGFRSMFSIS